MMTEWPSANDPACRAVNPRTQTARKVQEVKNRHFVIYFSLFFQFDLYFDLLAEFGFLLQGYFLDDCLDFGMQVISFSLQPC